jgi:hypothetical protein
MRTIVPFAWKSAVCAAAYLVGLTFGGALAAPGPSSAR